LSTSVRTRRWVASSTGDGGWCRAGFTVCNALLKALVRPGGLVAVQGIGGLGHLGLQYARKMGANVVAIARGTAKAGFSRQLGAHHYIDATARAGAGLDRLR
jgi:D-arabinose 1-dehydrogenase-like Zn-dependent alcohol dehydrogenase